jgi:hypothetical protein
MKYFCIILMIGVIAVIAVAAPKEKESVKTDAKVHEILAEEEDCDEKAKKVIEIKPETITLGGGDTGCSLDDM